MARKVETREDMKQGIDLGYSFFQGNFYEKPEVVARKDVPAFKYNYLKFMKELNAVDMSYKKMEQIIKQEMSLSVKLLRYINSAFFGLRAEVKSIGQAIRLLGELQVKRWGSIVSLAGTGEDKPSELVMVGMVRGRLCELLTDDVKYNINPLDAFLVGMLSIIDALLDRPMKEVLSNLSIAKGVSGALLGEKNHLRQLLDLVLSFENGQWEFVKAHSKKLGLEEDRINKLYLEALDWSIKVFNVG
jgi:EAL and modified HD-GYP domain-containing signal transduction protein